MVGTAKAGAPVLDPTWERAGVKFPRATRLPLYRQAQMLKRQGITLDRSTLSAWVGRACWWLTPLYELVLGTVLSSDKRDDAAGARTRQGKDQNGTPLVLCRR